MKTDYFILLVTVTQDRINLHVFLKGTPMEILHTLELVGHGCKPELRLIKLGKIIMAEYLICKWVNNLKKFKPIIVTALMKKSLLLISITVVY